MTQEEIIIAHRACCPHREGSNRICYLLEEREIGSCDDTCHYMRKFRDLLAEMPPEIPPPDLLQGSIDPSPSAPSVSK